MSGPAAERIASGYGQDASAFDDGFQMGGRVEHDAAVRAVALAALAVLGKDRGDGPVDLGALGTWLAPATPLIGHDGDGLMAS